MSFNILNYSLENVKDQLAKQAMIIDTLCQVSEVQARWKPSATEWSILEVICHMYDEEREDFRVRLAHLLSNPEEEWPAINPEDWVIERDYASQNHIERLRQFLQERQTSIKWLVSLVEPKWGNKKVHPELGGMTAEDMLFAWLTHDIRHIQQLGRLHYGYLKVNCNDAIRYAG